MGYVPAIGSFEKGSIITERFQVLLWEATNEYWRWDGSPFPPKIVLPGSTRIRPAVAVKGSGWTSPMQLFAQTWVQASRAWARICWHFVTCLGARLRWVIICVMRIFECTRYELLQAIEHINNDLQHPAEIKARNFASWNDAKTDIDITYASIVGEGGNVVIDAQGIPDAAGNYFMRIFNSKKSDINNLANIFTVKQQPHCYRPWP
jgi:hypothetical protein